MNLSQKKRLKTLRRHHRAHLKKAKQKTQTTALAVKAAPQAPQAIVRIESAVPSVLNTVKSLETVRRFVSRAMNTELQRAEAKLKPNEKLPDEVRKRLEVDWGTIPGVDKPFLLQPGAEKFAFWLQLRPKFFNRELDLGNGHIEIVSKVVFYSKKTNEEVFEGPECSCTSMESNYRFRFQERPENVPPPDRDEAKKLSAAGLGRWKKKADWKNGKKVGENWVWFDRVENPNIYDERNKVRQIGEKRALVKGVKNMGALSEIFVTNPDEWDIPEEGAEGPDVDERYTEGGRRIVTESEHERQYHERERKGLDKLTKEQREVIERRMKDAEEKKGGDAPRTEQPVSANSATQHSGERESGGTHAAEKHATAGPEPQRAAGFAKAKQPAGPKPVPEATQGTGRGPGSDRETGRQEPGPKPEMVPCFFYKATPSGLYEISGGTDELKKANKDLLLPLWRANATPPALLATPEELGRLLSQLELRKISVRELQ